MIYLSAILSLFATIALIPIFIKLALRFRIVDVPDARKVHSSAIPRIGGIAIALGATIPMIFWEYATDFTRAYLAGAGLLVIMGLLDDWKGLGYRVKFTAQIAAALIVVLFGGIKITTLGSLLPENFLLPDWFAIPLTVIAVVGVTNAINLSDGLDGLAGGICLLSFCSIAYLAYLIDNTSVVFIAISLAAAIFGFLRFNTYPATLFMGDTGSQFLGFSLVILSLAITQGSTPLSPLLPLIIVGFPVLDTLAVMFERISQGRSPFAADKNHLHHKLMQLGLYQTESVFFIYVLQGFLVASTILFKFYSEWFLLLGYLIFSGLILGGFFVAERSGWRLRRFALIDGVIKGRLKILRERGWFIKISFRIVAVGIPLLVLVTCLVPTTIPSYFSILSASLLGVLLVIWFYKRNWLRGGLTLILYLFIPFVVYWSVASEAPWINGNLDRFYRLLYIGLAFFVIMTLRFTKRRQGFKSTPMDFLILFIAVGVPYIAGLYVKNGDLASMVARIIMLFFSYEVLIGELREKLNRLAIATGASLALVVVRGLV